MLMVGDVMLQMYIKCIYKTLYSTLTFKMKTISPLKCKESLAKIKKKEILNNIHAKQLT